MPIAAMESHRAKGHVCSLWDMVNGAKASKPVTCQHARHVGDVDSIPPPAETWGEEDPMMEMEAALRAGLSESEALDAVLPI